MKIEISAINDEILKEACIVWLIKECSELTNDILKFKPSFIIKEIIERDYPDCEKEYMIKLSFNEANNVIFMIPVIFYINFARDYKITQLNKDV